MKKKKYKLTRTPVRQTQKALQITSSSQLDWGTINDLSKMDAYFNDLFDREADSIKELGLDPYDLSISIAQISNAEL